MAMSAVVTDFTEGTPLVAAPSILERSKNHILREFVASIEEWSGFVHGLRKFQDEQLLDDPTAASLEWHRRTLQTFISFGEFVLNATKLAEFPDQKTNLMVEATLQILRDDLVLWHGHRNTSEKNAKILAACFPEK